jgi:hypothetical protein
MASVRTLLERVDEPIHVLQVDATLGVRDQRDRQLVDARVAGERTRGQLRQLAVVAARQALTDLADVLADDVEVVEQPLAGGADVRVVGAAGGETRVDVTQDAPRLDQARQQRRRQVAPRRRLQPLPGRHGAHPLRQVLRPEQLATQRARERLGRRRRAAPEQPAEETWRHVRP